MEISRLPGCTAASLLSKSRHGRKISSRGKSPWSMGPCGGLVLVETGAVGNKTVFLVKCEYTLE